MSKKNLRKLSKKTRKISKKKKLMSIYQYML